jgi:hypothetical protein
MKASLIILVGAALLTLAAGSGLGYERTVLIEHFTNYW